MPFKKGNKLGGRRKGVPNRTTAEVREVFKKILDDLAPEAEQWIRDTAAGVEVERIDDEGQTIKVRLPGDPKGAADLLLKLAEFHVPKLARTEVTGKDGEALTIKVMTLESTKP